MIEINEICKFSDICNVLRDESIKDLLDLHRIRSNTIFRNNMIEKFNFIFKKFTFIKIEDYINLIKKCKNLLDILFMFRIYFIEDKNIVQIYNNKYVNKWCEDLIHILLKDNKYIHKIKKYDISLKLIIMNRKYCFQLEFIIQQNLSITWMKI